MLKNLLHDNSQIVDKVSAEHLDYFLAWLVKQKNPDFLDFLGVLCVCEGRAMPHHQADIMKKILAIQDKTPILMTSKVVDGALVIQDRGSSTWVSASEFLKNDAVSLLTHCDNIKAIID